MATPDRETISDPSLMIPDYQPGLGGVSGTSSSQFAGANQRKCTSHRGSQVRRVDCYFFSMLNAAGGIERHDGASRFEAIQ